MTDLLLHLFIPKGKEGSGNRLAYGNLASIVCIVCNVLLCSGKIAAGAIFGSIAILADGLNNLSDASSNVISLIGFKLGSAPADSKHPYGHARYEYIAALAVSVMILVIGVELGKESLAKTLHPEIAQFSWLSAGVLVVSILVKFWMAAFNRKIGRMIDSEVLLATAADSRNDVISTAAVLVALFLTKLTGIQRIDGLMGLAVALFILYGGIGMVRDTLSTLLGEAPDPEFVKHIENTVRSYPGVLGVHDLMVHDYGPGRRFAVLHVEMPAETDVLESHDLIDNIERDLWAKDHIHVTIHYDPIVTSDPHVEQVRELLQKKAAQLDAHLNVHDVRLVVGKTHTNVVFDCVVPPDCKLTHEEIRKAFADTIKTAYPDHYCVLKLENSYTGGQD